MVMGRPAPLGDPHRFACGPARPSSVFGNGPDVQTMDCKQVTVENLWNDPWPYAGKRICVSGFLGRMVPYGEDSADLFATKEEASLRQSERYVTISLLLSLKAQEELAGYSGRLLVVVGTFKFDERCWPRKGEMESRFQCFPPRPMELLSPTLRRARDAR
jgi:hypothetical protein